MTVSPHVFKFEEPHFINHRCSCATNGRNILPGTNIEHFELTFYVCFSYSCLALLQILSVFLAFPLLLGIPPFASFMGLVDQQVSFYTQGITLGLLFAGQPKQNFFIYYFFFFRSCFCCLWALHHPDGLREVALTLPETCVVFPLLKFLSWPIVFSLTLLFIKQLYGNGPLGQFYCTFIIYKRPLPWFLINLFRLTGEVLGRDLSLPTKTGIVYPRVGGSKPGSNGRRVLARIVCRRAVDWNLLER